jgi:hypothetical protein
LRRFVERKGWDTIADLDTLIESFVHDYNNSKHSSTGKTPNDLMAIELKEDVKQEAKLQHMTGKKRMGNTEGFRVAKLEVGDKVRIYDPRRTEIKGEQKEELKGKIKLSEKDYVKKFTSRHRGIAPHWTKKIFTVERIIKGRRAPRYVLEGRKGAFIRSELQKIKKVTKADKRKKPRIPKKKKIVRVATSVIIRADNKKFLGKELITKFQDEDAKTDDPAICILVYKRYPIVYYTVSKDVSFIYQNEVLRFTGKTSTKEEVDELVRSQAKLIGEAIKEIKEDIAEEKRKAGLAKEAARPKRKHKKPK